MKILLVTHSDLNDNNGGARVSNLILKALKSKKNISLTVISPTEIESSGSIIFLSEKRRNIFRYFFDFINLRFHKFYNIFKEEYRKGYDVIIFDGSIIGGDLIKMVDKRIKSISIHHNYDPKYYRDVRSVISFFGLFTFHLKIIQKKCLDYSDVNICLSEYDKNKLIRLSPTSKVFNWGTFLDNEIVNKKNNENIIDNKRIVISGDLSNYQNEYSIVHFVKNIWMKLNLEYELTIIGRNPSHKFSNFLRKNNILLIENPNNYISEISKGLIYLAVNHIGGGVKIKIHDPLSLGMPVLAHRVSSKGYEKLHFQPWFRTYSCIDEFETAFNFLISQQFDRMVIKNIFIDEFSKKKGITEFLKISKL